MVGVGGRLEAVTGMAELAVVYPFGLRIEAIRPQPLEHTGQEQHFPAWAGLVPPLKTVSSSSSQESQSARGPCSLCHTQPGFTRELEGSRAGGGSCLDSSRELEQKAWPPSALSTASGREELRSPPGQERQTQDHLGLPRKSVLFNAQVPSSGGLGHLCLGCRPRTSHQRGLNGRGCQ